MSQKQKRRKRYKVCDLCTGTGGFSLGLEKTKRFKTVYALDFELGSKVIFDHNFNIELKLEDVNNININELPNFDILTAGIPCQPFSIAGKRLGFEDTRGNVFWRIRDILKEKKPSFFIIENVKNCLKAKLLIWENLYIAFIVDIRL